jgi:hypothetical protein
MKLFNYRDRQGYVAYAASGGQSLSLWPGSIADAIPTAPKCFKGLEEFGKIHDQDAARLTATAKRLGIRVVYIDRRGTPEQHIDLCRGPLEKAKAEAAQAARKSGDSEGRG